MAFRMRGRLMQAVDPEKRVTRKKQQSSWTERIGGSRCPSRLPMRNDQNIPPERAYMRKKPFLQLVSIYLTQNHYRVLLLK
ncbi:hypothetical protein D9758_012721 [Tetrapyrgos nigripes]|uniref:Uncharacterized protein n=1 Tax=Tetrapyrgos nigripes TaxID=182062 RepID=A0A8H5CW46_9AGAR|nr:hypothetical protein D9758_012721 [Tetrapyrgos nigripes]